VSICCMPIASKGSCWEHAMPNTPNPVTATTTACGCYSGVSTPPSLSPQNPTKQGLHTGLAHEHCCAESAKPFVWHLSYKSCEPAARTTALSVALKQPAGKVATGMTATCFA
jgi:hypothetical protein